MKNYLAITENVILMTFAVTRFCLPSPEWHLVLCSETYAYFCYSTASTSESKYYKDVILTCYKAVDHISLHKTLNRIR